MLLQFKIKNSKNVRQKDVFGMSGMFPFIRNSVQAKLIYDDESWKNTEPWRVLPEKLFKGAGNALYPDLDDGYRRIFTGDTIITSLHAY